MCGVANMNDDASNKLDDIPFESPVVPQKMTNEDTFNFRCHKGVSCFNECCKAIDITLTPYDILTLKNLLKIDSRQFLATYTVPFELDGHGMPGVKLKTVGDTTQCAFLTEEGCGVYEGRPVSCRYYALGLMSMRGIDQPIDENYYFIVNEPHCKGHEEDFEQTIGNYRKGQGIPEFDDINREWNQLILKKRSSGPTIGKPSKRSLQLYFMACYNIDSFREFVMSEGFSSVYDLDDDFFQEIKSDEVKLLKFAFKFLKQVLFGENTIALKSGAVDARVDSRKEAMAERQKEDQDRDFDARYGDKE
jgi:uncharacterized protein